VISPEWLNIADEDFVVRGRIKHSDIAIPPSAESAKARYAKHGRLRTFTMRKDELEKIYLPIASESK
jgi:hypothetical protein